MRDHPQVNLGQKSARRRGVMTIGSVAAHWSKAAALATPMLQPHERNHSRMLGRRRLANILVGAGSDQPRLMSYLRF